MTNPTGAFIHDIPEEEIGGVLGSGNVIETANGLGYDYTNPDPRVLSLKGIATALGNACRFAGNLREFGLFCSVAEHSVLVSRILERQGHDRVTVCHGLMHDAHEFAVFDAPRPMKPTLGPAFREAAERADGAIARRFGLDVQRFHSPEVKLADDMALVHESLLYMKYGADRWENRPEVPVLPEGLHHHGFQPMQAQHLFYDRARELGIKEKP